MIEIITARPVGMDYETYRIKRKNSQRQIKSRIKHGELVYISSQIIVDPITKTKIIETYPPAIKHFDRNGNVIYKPMEKKVLK